jgi:hypothetical protein
MQHLERVQAAMRAEGLDALLLGGEAAGQYVGGHTRIGVHMPGWPIPVTVIPVAGLPHVVTADPDGALGLPADHVHGMMWNPQSLVQSLQEWLVRGADEVGVVSQQDAGLRLGTDALSPGGRALIEAAIPGATVVDATRLLAEVMLRKSAEEIEALGALCQFVTAAAEKALAGGRAALLDALDGAFPIAFPQVSAGRACVAVRRGGVIGEARLGPGDPARGDRALELLRPGSAAGDIAAALPASVEVVGLGGSYEAPLLRNGWAWPADLVLQSGAVLAVHWDSCGVSVAIEDEGPRVLALSTSEVVR